MPLSPAALNSIPPSRPPTTPTTIVPRQPRFQPPPVTARAKRAGDEADDDPTEQAHGSALLGEALGEGVELVVQRGRAGGRRTRRSAPRSTAARRATRPRRPTSSSSSAPGASCETVGRQRVGRREPADRGVARRGVVRTAAEHPREHAAVLAVARPEELAVGVLAEPVDVEELRQLLVVGATRRGAASARSSRPCCSRRTAASRTGRGAGCRPRRPRPRSSPSP